MSKLLLTKFWTDGNDTNMFFVYKHESLKSPQLFFGVTLLLQVYSWDIFMSDFIMCRKRNKSPCRLYRRYLNSSLGARESPWRLNGRHLHYCPTQFQQSEWVLIDWMIVFSYYSQLGYHDCLFLMAAVIFVHDHLRCEVRFDHRSICDCLDSYRQMEGVLCNH